MHDKFKNALCCLNRNLTFFITTFCNSCKIKHCPCLDLANNPHTSKKGELYELPAIRDKHMGNIVFSVASHAWNGLPSIMKLVTNMNAFKTNLATLIKPCKKNELYNFRSKIGNSYQTQLRVGRSQLNGHLFEIGLSNTPSCLCGHKWESDPFSP
jgi:hypothetical protein